MTAPTVDPCSCTRTGIAPEHCQDACAGTARLVWGGVLPTLSHVADKIRGLVREDLAVSPRARVFEPEWLDELCVLAESAERHGGQLHALKERVRELEERLEAEREHAAAEGAVLGVYVERLEERAGGVG